MLSHLQQYILEECALRGGGISRRLLHSNYQASRSRSRADNYKKIITQSIERLIERGFLVGYGRKTREKLFIDKIRLTAAGRPALAKLRQRQQPRLPLRRQMTRGVTLEPAKGGR